MKALWGAFVLGVIVSAAVNLTDLHIRICFGPADTCQKHWNSK